MRRQNFLPCVFVFGLVALSFGFPNNDSRPNVAFSKPTIDFGIVVSDIDKSLDFYKNGLGFTEVEGFDVSAEIANHSGLADITNPLHIHVLVLGDGPSATKVKLMQFKEKPGQPVDHKYIHNSLGMSYMTVWVEDMNAATKAAAAFGAKPRAQGPVELPGGNLFLTVYSDPDGNVVELVGPKK